MAMNWEENDGGEESHAAWLNPSLDDTVISNHTSVRFQLFDFTSY